MKLHTTGCYKQHYKVSVSSQVAGSECGHDGVLMKDIR